DSMFKKESAGGGVLIDTGSHTLDALLWWLGDVAQFDYADDAEGGVEADCEIHLTMASGATGVVELSRTRELGNKVVIHGKHATLEAMPGKVSLIVNGCRVSGVADREDGPPTSDQYLPTIAASLHDWLDAIRFDRPPLVTGEEGRRSV